MPPVTSSQARLRSAFDQHQAALLRYCLRRLPRQDVEDAVARVFAVAWRKIDEMPEGEGGLPWLYRIASYEVATIRRSQRRLLSLRERLHGLASSQSEGPDTVVVRNAEHEAIVVSLDALAEADREVIMLRCYEELSGDELAAALGCSPQAARQRLSRALRRFRDQAGLDQAADPSSPEGGAS